MDRYVVFGNPIGHSKSPTIHRLFAEQAGQQLEYRTQVAPLGGFGECAREFFQAGGLGANVTVPFKEDAYRFCDELTLRAQRAGAVNMLSRQGDGGVRGDNTDGEGLVRDLTANAGLPLAGKRILLLGAGGAARGVLEPLLEEAPAQVVLANRTLEKAQRLVEAFAELGPLRASAFAELAGPFDVIINATAASLAGEIPPVAASLIEPGRTACYDMMYGKAPTPFCHWATEHGAVKALDGLGMLVEQAAVAFRYWRGVEVDTAPVLANLRQQLLNG
ncbi:shikimate dehydrogenase [Pseudomonas typographi]|uniref:Shikimate dehydrogenase (NADP(+)) n=1 Tax=Pseudomonas typographi TaxID=2715964 RepID=A0ABR7Z410_9PSED|nr:shikimate dehydrogenase [Pseudomonas typographi]MBD1552905.1 shikimate dehydrogenase [Pseudomonas typographi]MBD1588280.1 shikimate dehydrogenase [Pseudomonas typographi]MBD1600251.1 shikimate dehydrogenase [Pseudomonas typographi]